MQYIIEGGNKLSGKIKISGNKNSTFPCMAAALLTDEEVELENIPDISDVEVFKQLLISVGAEVSHVDKTVKIKAGELKPDLPQQLMARLRGSIVLVGALLARLGEVNFYFPGGDVIGQRGIEVHLDGFKALGAQLSQKDLRFELRYKDKQNSADICSIFFPITSVTGTENLILASVLGKGNIILKNCAKEPHVIDLCNMLISMGAKIDGVGTDQLIIKGVEKLHGTKFKISIDYIEVGTYAVAAAITGGNISVEDIDQPDLLDPVIIPLKQFGLEATLKDSELAFKADSLHSVPRLITNTWPGFPTDLMSIAIILATQSRGITLCHDWMYESRIFFVDKLISMGADITIADPHRVVVYGPARLSARELETPDIRAGMALVLAALIARGTSHINKTELIERGYEDVVGKLKSLGAKIEKA